MRRRGEFEYLLRMGLEGKEEKTLGVYNRQCSGNVLV